MVQEQRARTTELLDNFHRAEERAVQVEENYKAQLDSMRSFAAAQEEGCKRAQTLFKALEDRGKELDKTFAAANEEHRAEVERLLSDCHRLELDVKDRDEKVQSLKKELADANKLIEKLQKHGECNLGLNFFHTVDFS
jgi:predicted RNase H-like nuclease (RuvC/YqgF family)